MEKQSRFSKAADLAPCLLPAAKTDAVLGLKDGRVSFLDLFTDLVLRGVVQNILQLAARSCKWSKQDKVTWMFNGFNSRSLQIVFSGKATEPPAPPPGGTVWIVWLLCLFADRLEDFYFPNQYLLSPLAEAGPNLLWHSMPSSTTRSSVVAVVHFHSKGPK